MNIWTAAADNNLAKVKEFLRTVPSGANAKDQNGYTPIHAAAEYAHLDLLRFLVENGGNVNVQDNDGDTPLHACEQVSVADLLIELGASLETQNSAGLTPLQKAEEDGDFLDLIAFLRQKSGVALANDEKTAIQPENVRVSLEAPPAEDTEIPLQVSNEQRAKLEKIIENGTDGDFEQYLQQVLGNQSDETKRAKSDH